jgi:uncharacterized damage-inducible protein DinB
MPAPSHAPTPEFVAIYTAMMLDGAAREMETTKKVIAAVPDAKREHRPDPHARTAWELAWHLANTDVYFLDSIADMKFTMGEPKRPNEPTKIADLVAWYDREMKRAIARVRAMSPAQLATPVDFAGVFNLPAAFYLGFLNNHSIHHRGELATYLRPMGSKVPSIYGGSYDEPFQMPGEKTSAA